MVRNCFCKFCISLLIHLQFTLALSGNLPDIICIFGEVTAVLQQQKVQGHTHYPKLLHHTAHLSSSEEML